MKRFLPLSVVLSALIAATGSRGSLVSYYHYYEKGEWCDGATPASCPGGTGFYLRH